MYCRLSSLQEPVFNRFVRGTVVHDLGAGNLGLSVLAMDAGAKKVFAVDKMYSRAKRTRVREGIEVVGSYFHEYKPEDVEVALLSWPTNMVDRSLLALAQRAKTVIYIGKNTDGTACGYPDLFQNFLDRELLVYRPHRANVLAVYGDRLAVRRPPTGEEYAGMNTRLCTFEEAEKLAADLGKVVHELATESL